MADTLLYLYAVSRDRPSGLDGLTGVLDGPVGAISSAGLYGIVSPVPADEFAQHRIDDRLQDLEWLSTTARAHHRVVDEVGRGTVVAPLALATVFADEDRVRAALDSRRAEFDTVLDRLHGRAEWGLKAYAPARPAPSGAGGGERPASGTEYLRRRKAAVGAAEEHTAEAFRAAEDLHRAVAEVAVDSRRHRVHDAALTGRSEQMVLNAAYLVDTGAVDRWRQVADRAAPEGLLVEVTGPWVPYSFAAVHAEGGTS